MMWETSPENSDAEDNYYIRSQEDIAHKRISFENISEQAISKKNSPSKSNVLSTSILSALNSNPLLSTIPEQIRSAEDYNDFVFSQSQKSQELQVKQELLLNCVEKNKKSKKRKLELKIEVKDSVDDTSRKNKKRKKNKDLVVVKTRQISPERSTETKEVSDINNKKDNLQTSLSSDQVLINTESNESLNTICNETNQLFSQFRDTKTDPDRVSFDSASQPESIQSVFSVDSAKLTQMRSHLDSLGLLNESEVKIQSKKKKKKKNKKSKNKNTNNSNDNNQSPSNSKRSSLIVEQEVNEIVNESIADLFDNNVFKSPNCYKMNLSPKSPVKSMSSLNINQNKDGNFVAMLQENSDSGVNKNRKKFNNVLDEIKVDESLKVTEKLGSPKMSKKSKNKKKKKKSTSAEIQIDLINKEQEFLLDLESISQQVRISEVSEGNKEVVDVTTSKQNKKRKNKKRKKGTTNNKDETKHSNSDEDQQHNVQKSVMVNNITIETNSQNNTKTNINTEDVRKKTSECGLKSVTNNNLNVVMNIKKKKEFKCESALDVSGNNCDMNKTNFNESKIKKSFKSRKSDSFSADNIRCKSKAIIETSDSSDSEIDLNKNKDVNTCGSTVKHDKTKNKIKKSNNSLHEDKSSDKIDKKLDKSDKDHHNINEKENNKNIKKANKTKNSIGSNKATKQNLSNSKLKMTFLSSDAESNSERVLESENKKTLTKSHGIKQERSKSSDKQKKNMNKQQISELSSESDSGNNEKLVKINRRVFNDLNEQLINNQEKRSISNDSLSSSLSSKLDSDSEISKKKKLKRSTQKTSGSSEKLKNAQNKRNTSQDKRNSSSTSVVFDSDNDKSESVTITSNKQRTTAEASPVKQMINKQTNSSKKRKTIDSESEFFSDLTKISEIIHAKEKKKKTNIELNVSNTSSQKLLNMSNIQYKNKSKSVELCDNKEVDLITDCLNNSHFTEDNHIKGSNKKKNKQNLVGDQTKFEVNKSNQSISKSLNKSVNDKSLVKKKRNTLSPDKKNYKSEDIIETFEDYSDKKVKAIKKQKITTQINKPEVIEATKVIIKDNKCFNPVNGINLLKTSSSFDSSDSDNNKVISSNVTETDEGVETRLKENDSKVNSFLENVMSSLMKPSIKVEEDTDLSQVFVECPSPIKSRKRRTMNSTGPNEIENFDHLQCNITEEEFLMLKYLLVQIDFQIAPLHQIEKYVVRNINEQEMELVRALGVEPKRGNYTPDETKIITDNWERFCEMHNLPQKPELFMKLCIRGPNKERIIKREETVKFVQFIANGLPNRLLNSVYKRFKTIFATYKRGKFTAEESEIILDTVQNTKDSSKIFARLGLELNRQPLAVEKHYIWMRESQKHDFKVDRIRDEDRSPVIRKLLEYMECDDIYDLKYKLIPYAVYSKVGEELKLRPLKIQHYWLINLHPKLFVTGTRNMRMVKRQLIDLILGNPEFKTQYHVTYLDFIPYMDGWTTIALGLLLRNILKTVNNCNDASKDFREKLLYFKNELNLGENSKLKEAKFINGELIIVD